MKMFLSILTFIIRYKTVLLLIISGLLVAIITVLLSRIQGYKEEADALMEKYSGYKEQVVGSQHLMEQGKILSLTMDEIREEQDIIIRRLDSLRKKIGLRDVTYQMSQKTRVEDVSSKPIPLYIPDSLSFSDSIMFNDETVVRYALHRDTISIDISMENTQSLYIYEKKRYRRRSFFQRLIHLDFSRLKEFRYLIRNTNSLLKTDSVRIVKTEQE